MLMRRLLTSFLLIFFVSFIRFDVASAAQPNLSLSPVRAEYEIEPGTKQMGNVRITNNYNKPINVDLSAEEFNVINQNYDYVFTEDSDVVKWIGFEEININLAAGESREIGYSLGVPNNAEPGGRYISIFATTDVVGDDNSLISKQRVASLLYVTVQGDVTRTGSLVKFNAPWFITGDGTWSATVRNSGTAHFHSVYSVTVTDVFGSVVYETSDRSLIFPASIKLVTADLPAMNYPGLYIVKYKIGLGDSPQIEKESPLLYLPVWFLISIFSLILFLLTRLIVKKIKHQSV